jgi:predicted SAM-dependent methyltransferase
MITTELEAKKFEHKISWLKLIYYQVERTLGNLFFRKQPKIFAEDVNLLNLGCGPLMYKGWCNADDFAFKRSLRERSFRPEWRLDLTKNWNCRSNVWDGIFSQHVLEHLTYSEAIHVLRECQRTMKFGAYIRISVPSLDKYINFYNGNSVSPEYAAIFPNGALAISFISQMHSHKSLWNSELLRQVMTEVGFIKVAERSFLEGEDSRLLKDQDVKNWESLYVEGRK